MTGASLSTSDGPRWGHARAYGTAQSGIPAATLRLSFDGVRVVRAGSRVPPPICVALAKLATRQPLFVTRQPHRSPTAYRLPEQPSEVRRTEAPAGCNEGALRRREKERREVSGLCRDEQTHAAAACLRLPDLIRTPLFSTRPLQAAAK